MKTFELNFKYKGALIEGSVLPEENYDGWTYDVVLNETIEFRLYCDDNGEWSLLRGDNGMKPNVEADLLEQVIYNIEELKQGV